jgi:hypothetical protein
LEPGSYVYHQVERFSRDSADGAKLVPTFQGPYLVRDRVAGSKHRYLLSRTQTSALFEAHITRLKAAPAQTFEPVVLSSMASDFSGAGRGAHLQDPTRVHEIDRIVASGRKGFLIRFVGSETADRWVELAELQKQGLGDLVACYRDREPATLAKLPGESTPRYTMSAISVARLEGSRTHDAFGRAYQQEAVGWNEQCELCGTDGVADNKLLCCSFCPRTYHFGCCGLAGRTKAMKGDWPCPDCRVAHEGTRSLDGPIRRAQRRRHERRVTRWCGRPRRFSRRPSRCCLLRGKRWTSSQWRLTPLCGYC